VATVIGLWVTELCLASASPERGELWLSLGVPVSVDDLVDYSGLSAETVGAINDQFAALGMIKVGGDAIVITNWGNRQFKSDSDAAERQRRSRANRHVTVTTGGRDNHMPEAEADSDSHSDTNAASSANDDFNRAIMAYERNIGIISATVRDALEAAVKDYPPGWVAEAIEEAARANGRSWNYAAAILQRWGRDGKGKRNGNGHKPLAASGAEHLAQLARELEAG
jgi:DnaD/phage-associated family protein